MILTFRAFHRSPRGGRTGWTGEVTERSASDPIKGGVREKGEINLQKSGEKSLPVTGHRACFGVKMINFASQPAGCFRCGWISSGKSAGRPPPRSRIRSGVVFSSSVELRDRWERSLGAELVFRLWFHICFKLKLSIFHASEALAAARRSVGFAVFCWQYMLVVKGLLKTETMLTWEEGPAELLVGEQELPKQFHHREFRTPNADNDAKSEDLLPVGEGVSGNGKHPQIKTSKWTNKLNQ